MLKPRLIEEKMLILLRQGKISKWFSGIGQEAISVGVALWPLNKEEYILPMHRNLGVFTTREDSFDFAYFVNGKEKLQCFHKRSVIVPFILAPKNIILLV